MAKLIDNAIALRVLWMLTTPFERTDAYRLGIIDKKGKEITPMSKLNTDPEREAYTYLHRLVFRLKRIIHMVPVESKNFLSFAAAVALVKEGVEYEDDILEELFYDTLNVEFNRDKFNTLMAALESYDIMATLYL